MRKLMLNCFLLFAATSFAQIPELKIETYLLHESENEFNQIILQMPYAGSSINLLIGDTIQLRRTEELSIDIVCTDYPSHLNLFLLNDARLQALFKQFPFLKEKKLKIITIYRQVEGATKQKAQAMFHGVVVRFRPKQDKETMKHDLSKLEELLTPLSDGEIDIIETVPGPMEKSTDTSKRFDYSKDEIATSSISTDSLTIVRRTEQIGMTSEVVKKFNKRDKEFKDADSMSVMTPFEALNKKYLTKGNYVDTWAKYDKVTVFFKSYMDTIVVWSPTTSLYLGESALTYRQMPDSIILKVFKRNSWKNTAVVADVTGSMYPYSAQLLLWLKLNSTDKLTNRFTFFNDGDEKRDDEKVIGDTKGIYNDFCFTFNDVKNLLYKTMQKGGGGDTPENNIEALLRTEEAYPEIEYTILIADNWANLKDKSLSSRLKKPVRIVVCGVSSYGINVDYLNLARKTGGSVHLMEEDLYNLAILHEGEEIKIGFRKFKIKDGEFIEVPKESEL